MLKPPTLVSVSFDDVPPNQKHVIRSATFKICSIKKPRSFQAIGINHMSYNNDTFFVINIRTADLPVPPEPIWDQFARAYQPAQLI